MINRSFSLLPGTITVKTNEWKYVNDCFINIFSNIIGNDRQPLAVSKAKTKKEHKKQSSASPSFVDDRKLCKCR